MFIKWDRRFAHVHVLDKDFPYENIFKHKSTKATNIVEQREKTNFLNSMLSSFYTDHIGCRIKAYMFSPLCNASFNSTVCILILPYWESGAIFIYIIYQFFNILFKNLSELK